MTLLRFWFCCLLSACLYSCGGPIGDDLESEEVEMVGVPPWHLWGNSKTIVVPHAVAIIQESTQQLTKVQYKRPDTWTFLFAAKIIDASDREDFGQLRVDFDVTFGVGRDHLTIPSFVFFIFEWEAPADPLVTPNLKWTTQTTTPILNDVPEAQNIILPVTEIPAEQINVQARLSFTGGEVASKTVTVEIFNFWAPKTHNRPDWYLRSFQGDEVGGS